jgi:hypothetical protein
LRQQSRSTPHLRSIDDTVGQDLLQAHRIADYFARHHLINLQPQRHLGQVAVRAHHRSEQTPDINHAPEQLQLARVDGA